MKKLNHTLVSVSSQSFFKALAIKNSLLFICLGMLSLNSFASNQSQAVPGSLVWLPVCKAKKTQQQNSNQKNKAYPVANMCSAVTYVDPLLATESLSAKAMNHEREQAAVQAKDVVDLHIIASEKITSLEKNDESLLGMSQSSYCLLMAQICLNIGRHPKAALYAEAKNFYFGALMRAKHGDFDEAKKDECSAIAAIKNIPNLIKEEEEKEALIKQIESIIHPDRNCSKYLPFPNIPASMNEYLQRVKMNERSGFMQQRFELLYEGVYTVTELKRFLSDLKILKRLDQLEKEKELKQSDELKKHYNSARSGAAEYYYFILSKAKQ